MLIIGTCFECFGTVYKTLKTGVFEWKNAMIYSVSEKIKREVIIKMPDNNLIGKIVFNKQNDIPVYYVVKYFDGITLRIEQLKSLPPDKNIELQDLEVFRKMHLNIIYYSKYEE